MFSIRWLFFCCLILTPLLSASAETEEQRTISFLPREEIDTTKMGLNAFVNDQRFGTIEQQFAEVRDTLRLKHVRVLFGWDDNVQPTADSSSDYSFYDDIAEALPKRVKALAVLTGLPSWMSNTANWVNENSRRTVFKRWIKPTILRYRRTKRIKAYQIWNEPNMSSNSENTTLEFLDSPENYLWLLRRSYRLVRRRANRKKVVSTATTSIIQNYPETLEYNQALFDLGAEQYLDRWGIHLYGTSAERLLIPGGPTDFLQSLSKPIWITESGRQGINEQLTYVERMWPYILDLVPGIERIYFYQFTEDSNSEETFGLKNLTTGETISDLYIYLRDRA